MFYDKRTQRKIQLLNLLIALLILIPILLDFSKGFMMGLNSSVIGFQNGLEESTFQICTVKPDSLQLNHIGTIPSLNLSSDKYSLPSGIDDTRSTEYKFRNTDWAFFHRPYLYDY